ncbi:MULTISPECIES: hypothetical protein [Desulfobacula]|uniref:Uncharacterized protein n=1 Tax=Desulfobacula phenolica TaxID=90732 RepID=A0A1H2I9I8_9BACT|nr:MULTISPECIES: hypothetical protein [Desulfobacula]SDU40807.1 hypothetical protein SAMN04487931_10815 [Desulfobacula phenolica]
MKQQIHGFTVQHLPIITAYAKKIGVRDVINSFGRPMEIFMGYRWVNHLANAPLFV